MNEFIQWPRAQYWDKPWNPIVGCWPCSPACDNCYARSMLQRFGQSLEPHETSKISPPQKGVVFCGNMTDLFGEWLWPGPKCTILYGMGDSLHKAKNGAATAYLWLTKRVERMIRTLQGHRMPTNHYFGFTAENQEWYDERFKDVMDGRWPQWANLWLSAEPLLGPIELTPLDLAIGGIGVPRIFKWLVVGCESGPKRRPCKIEWVESIVDQCRSAGVPLFVKQLDLNGKCETDITKFPAHLRIRQVPWARKEQA